MYSPNYDRPVFIDFGLSRLIEENIGFRTISNYVGTIDYWSPEMTQCYIDKKPMLIDLYLILKSSKMEPFVYML